MLPINSTLVMANDTVYVDGNSTPAHYADQLYLLTFGIMIVFMDVGFGLLEAGSVRTKNTTHILVKNILDSLLAGIAFWLFGYALAFGKGNGFIGWTNWAMAEIQDTEISFAVYQIMFASTATTIVAGAVSERCEFVAYLIYSFLLTAFIYPVVAHWGWSYEGWLVNGHDFVIDGQTVTIKYEDFGGSSVVHLVGGTAAFVATCFLGPRIGRFHKETGKPIPIEGHSVALCTVGIFVLLFGFMALNAGSQHHITYPGDAPAISLAVLNTLISASVGGVASLLTHRFGIFGNSWSLHGVINGAFVGMVSICGGCNNVRPWGAAVVGLVASFIMKGIELLLLRYKIDDPLNACGIHFGGGSWGAISLAFLKYDTGILFTWSQRSGAMLAWQFAGVLSIITWTGTLAVLVFGALKFSGIFRVPEEVEIKGLDVTRHKQHAYPIELHGQSHLHIMSVGEHTKVLALEQGYGHQVFVTNEDDDKSIQSNIRALTPVPSMVGMDTEKHPSSLLAIESAPPVVEMDSDKHPGIHLAIESPPSTVRENESNKHPHFYFSVETATSGIERKLSSTILAIESTSTNHAADHETHTNTIIVIDQASSIDIENKRPHFYITNDCNCTSSLVEIECKNCHNNFLSNRSMPTIVEIENDSQSSLLAIESSSSLGERDHYKVSKSFSCPRINVENVDCITYEDSGIELATFGEEQRLMK
ncbi:ammonium transporter 1 [Biomphalaria glabrata]|nr:ammonium transporter 1 [Biomphalaria glabrata]